MVVVISDSIKWLQNDWLFFILCGFGFIRQSLVFHLNSLHLKAVFLLQIKIDCRLLQIKF